MSHRLAIVAALFLLACGPGGKKSVAPENTTELCIDPTAKGGTAITLSQEELPSASQDFVDKVLEPGWFVWGSTTDRDRADVFAVISRDGCQDTGICEAALVRIVDGGGGPRITARVPLPSADKVKDASDAPFSVGLLAASDTDGDGESEIWVGYGLYQEVLDESLEVDFPGESSFPTGRYHVAVFAPDDLAPLLYIGHEDTPFGCDYELASVDADCDGDRDVVETRQCMRVQCSGSGLDESEPPAQCRNPEVEHIVHQRAADGSYARRP